MKKRSLMAGGMIVGLAAFLIFILMAAQADAAKRGFWISNLEGERFDSRKHKGPIAISFFFVDCVPCIVEVPQLHAMVTKKYPGVALLFVDPVGDDDAAYIKDFADRVGVPYKFFYRDPLSTLAKRYFKGQMVFPTIVGLKNGKERFRVNNLEEDSLKKIRAVLGR